MFTTDSLMFLTTFTKGLFPSSVTGKEYKLSEIGLNLNYKM